jgi:hypothetical protein
VAKEHGWHGPIFYEVFFKSALCRYLETLRQFLLECLNARFGEPFPKGVAAVLDTMEIPALDGAQARVPTAVTLLELLGREEGLLEILERKTIAVDCLNAHHRDREHPAD